MKNRKRKEQAVVAEKREVRRRRRGETKHKHWEFDSVVVQLLRSVLWTNSVFSRFQTVSAKLKRNICFYFVISFDVKQYFSNKFLRHDSFLCKEASTKKSDFLKSKQPFLVKLLTFQNLWSFFYTIHNTHTNSLFRVSTFISFFQNIREEKTTIKYPKKKTDFIANQIDNIAEIFSFSCVAFCICSECNICV